MLAIHPSVVRRGRVCLAVAAGVLAFACQRSRLLPARGSALETTRNQTVEVTTRYRRVGARPAIHFTLRNLAAKPLSLYPFELPWGNANSSDVSARDDAGEQLEAFYPIDDPGPESPLSIAPGASLEGDFILDRRIRHISERLRSSTVVIMWRYPCGNCGGAIGGALTGSLRVPREPS
jgi:hypothetical protein